MLVEFTDYCRRPNEDEHLNILFETPGTYRFQEEGIYDLKVIPSSQY